MRCAAKVFAFWKRFQCMARFAEAALECWRVGGLDNDGSVSIRWLESKIEKDLLRFVALENPGRSWCGPSSCGGLGLGLVVETISRRQLGLWLLWWELARFVVDIGGICPKMRVGRGQWVLGGGWRLRSQFLRRLWLAWVDLLCWALGGLSCCEAWCQGFWGL